MAKIKAKDLKVGDYLELRGRVIGIHSMHSKVFEETLDENVFFHGDWEIEVVEAIKEELDENQS